MAIRIVAPAISEYGELALALNPFGITLIIVVFAKLIKEETTLAASNFAYWFVRHIVRLLAFGSAALFLQFPLQQGRAPITVEVFTGNGLTALSLSVTALFALLCHWFFRKVRPE